MLCIIECKDYSHAVPVDDVEEFSDKLRQVQAHKGIIVTRSTFQKGAHALAKSRGMGLLRYFAPKRHKWILERTTAANIISASSKSLQDLAEVMTNEFESPVFDLACDSKHGATTSIWEFFSNLASDSDLPDMSQIVTEIKRIGGNVPFLQEAEIENTAQRISALLTSTGTVFNLDELCSFEHERSGLKVVKHLSTEGLEVSKHTLGRIVFDDNTIELFPLNAKDEQQLRFTLAHELGHFYLGHKHYLKLDTFDLDDLENSPQKLIELTDVKKLEWQANRFAASLLMPRTSFTEAVATVWDRLDMRNKGHGMIFVDSQPGNQVAFALICRDLAEKFGVSFGAVAVRLEQLGLLNDQRGKLASRI
jgi:Zn-dependent peptidase ImmA (M78 family)